MIYAVIGIIFNSRFKHSEEIFNQGFTRLITKCIQPIDNYRYSFQLTINIYIT